EVAGDLAHGAAPKNRVWVWGASLTNPARVQHPRREDAEGSALRIQHARLRLALAHEGELDHAHRHFLAADVDADLAGIAGRHAREGDRLAQRRRERARQDL